eukprot:TRINITY_DN12479_c0_g1_i2.p1 TRINITY_DN12479_c0_g1~~TRINITY_DN12479_c0_g1_i2.p1  ORF type:complete len:181 (-),score=38.24 TRINITY_DN12479_c0_g1_i2:601-1143(-)
MLLFFGFFFSIGVEIGTFAYWFLVYLMDHENVKTEAKNIAFFMPMCFSLIQLAFTLFVFRSESPNHLSEREMSHKGLAELQRFYTTIESRIEQFDILQSSARESKYQYPDYLELLSKKYIGWLLAGIAMVYLKSNAATYLLANIAETEGFNTYLNIFLIGYPFFGLLLFALSVLITRSNF